MFAIFDNYGQVFLTNNQLFTKNANTLQNFFPVGANYIAVKFENYDGPGGFIMSQSPGSCITNSSNWRCTYTNDPTWNSFSVFNDYYQWPLAVTYTYNDASSYPAYAEFSNDCPWIGIANSEYVGYVLCMLSSC